MLPSRLFSGLLTDLYELTMAAGYVQNCFDERTEAGEIKKFQPGIGLIASRLRLPVVPIRLRGVETVLHRHACFPHPGHVEIIFGPPLCLQGEDYAELAKQVETAVLAL